MQAPRSLSVSPSIQLRVKSFTRHRVAYNVRYSARKWTCDCPDARYRGNACKHVAILRLLGPRRAAAFAGGVCDEHTGEDCPRETNAPRTVLP